MNNDFGMGPDDTNPDDSYSPAPQPPHERMWRHPSEVGFAAVSLQALTPIDIGRRGRGLVGFSCIAGTVLIAQHHNRRRTDEATMRLQGVKVERHIRKTRRQNPT